MNYASPSNLHDAVETLANGEWKLLSGGTDYYPGLGDQLPHGNILDISKLEGLREIRLQADGSWSIGACATWTDVIKADLPAAFDGLKLAAREVGSIQIQNRATVVGNICNASPAADGVPPLLSLNASIVLSSKQGSRTVPLSDFIQGNRKIDLLEGELVTEVVIPESSAEGLSHFIKLGARKYLVISVSMVAARISTDKQNTIVDAAISVGSCSLVAKRLASLEKDLVGQSLSEDTCNTVNADHLAVLTPIDDVRATGAYRTTASLELVKRSISHISARA